MSNCQVEDDAVKNFQNSKMTSENIFKVQLLNELKNNEVIEFVANNKHITSSDELLKNNKITLYSSKNSIFQKITKPNEYVTYSIRLNSYTSLTPYYKYFIINKEISGIEKAGFVKYIPTSPTSNLDVDNFTGVIEIYNTQNVLFAKTTFLKGQPVIDSFKKNNSKTSSCYNTSYVVAIPCSHGGGHMPGQSCDNGLTNDAYYEIRTTPVCVDDIKSIVPPDTFGGGGGGSGGGAAILNLLNIPELYEGDPSFTNESFMFYQQVYNFLQANPAYNNLVNLNYGNSNLVNDWIVPTIVDYFRHNDFNVQQNQINVINTMNMFKTFISFESGQFNFEEMLVIKYQTFQFLLQNSQWLSSQTNQTKQDISNYLLQNHLNNESREFIILAINYLKENPDVTWELIKNWFFTTSEGKDGEEIVDLNNVLNTLIYQQRSLPSYTDFQNNFPKLNWPEYPYYYQTMPAKSVYSLIGGNLQSLYLNNDQDNGPYRNACAVRISLALNKLGIAIPKNSITRQGASINGLSKYYFLQAIAVNDFMIKTFGETSYKLEGAAANNKTEIAKLLKGKNGIYVIVNNDAITAGYTGHADLIKNGYVIGGPNTAPNGGVKSIRIWILN